MEKRVRRYKKKKRNIWPPLSYVILGIALFFGLVYGGEMIVRLITRPPATLVPSPSATPPLGEVPKGTPPSETMEVTLYFVDPDFTTLVGEKRTIPKTGNWLESVLQELLRGPKNSALFNPIPSATRLNAVFQEKDTVYVDLSEEMMKNQSGGTSQELLSVYAIVDTLTAFPEVKRVQILINGKEETTLCGHVDVSKPLERDEKLIAQIR